MYWCPSANQFHEPAPSQCSRLGVEAYDSPLWDDCAASSTTLPRVYPCTTLRQHSVELELDYINPWRALCNAWALRHQVIFENEPQHKPSSPWSWRQPKSSFLSSRRQRLKRTICFDDQVQWRFVDEANQICGWEVARLPVQAEPLASDPSDFDDVCSLMARRPVPSTPSSITGASDLETHEPTSPSSRSAQEPDSVWRSIQVYDLHSGHARGRVQIRPPELYFIHTRRLLGYTHHQVASIFDITPPPEDLAALHVHPLLLVCHDDLRFGDHRRAVLFDVELHGAEIDAFIDTDRYSTLIPQQVHRDLLLDIAGVAPYCKLQRSRCLVWLRGNLLSAASSSLYPVLHGDYIRIAAPPFEDPIVPTQFAVRACQAGLTRDQLIQRFRRHGGHDEDLFTDVEAAQPNVLPGVPAEADVDSTSFTQLAFVRPCNKIDVTTVVAAVPLTCRIDGEHHPPLQLERSLPGTFRNHDEARAHNVLPSWLADMHEAFTGSAAVEHEDEGPVGYIDTWFFRGHHPYVTEETRTFRADQYIEFWQNEIAELWRDRLNLHLPISFHWVRPTPKALATRDRIGHLLLLQDSEPNLVPTLVTIDMIGHQRTAFGFAAALLSNPVELFQLRDLLQLARHCLDRRCELKWFDHFWRHGQPLHVPSGAGLQFKVLPPIILAHLGSGHEVDPAVPIVTIPPEEPAAPAHPPIEAHSEIVRILHASWLALATPGPGGLEYVLRIQTWYLESGFVRHHDECRDVVLGEDFWNWETSISRRWADFVLHDSDLDLHLVQPAPPTASTPNEIHIILAQRLREFECASLVTTYDNAVLRGAPYTAAIILPAAVLQADIIRATGKHLVCPPFAFDSTCSCWHGGRQLPLTARYPNRNGYAFNLIVHRPLPPNFWDEDSAGFEATNFLQIKARAVSSDGRRLTTGPVAQTQWPSTADSVKQQTIDLRSPIAAFEVFDSHFFLPDFVFETIDPSHPASPWIVDWWDCSTPGSEIWVYYDGSAISTPEGPSATAAAAAFVKTYTGWFFAGSISTPLPFASDSYSAEHYASAISLKLGYDLLKVHEAIGSTVPSIHFCFDSLTVGHQTAGLWHCFKHPILGAVLRNIHRLIETRFDPMIFHWHVKGHSGHPGNELVDFLAQHAHRKEHDATTRWLATLGTHTFKADSDWFWILFDHEFHSCWEHHSLCFNMPCTWPTIGLLGNSDRPPPSVQHAGAQVHLRLATCNVLSLCGAKDDHECGITGPARQQMLLDQLAEERITIFALQETRLRRLHRAHSDAFLLFRAAATDKGHFGILVGLSRKRAFATTTTPEGQTVHHKFAEDQVSIILESPRVLILRVATKIIKFLIIAGHAPHTGHSQEEIAQWWNDIAKAIPKAYTDWPIVLLADANAVVGFHPSDAIGAHHAGPNEAKAEGFIDFVHSQRLWLPSTFEDYQCGPSDTWVHSSGTTRRIDFVGVPSLWPVDHCEAWTSSIIDPSITITDHLAACVDLRFRWECGTFFHFRSLPQTCQRPHQGPGFERAQPCSFCESYD